MSRLLFIAASLCALAGCGTPNAHGLPSEPSSAVDKSENAAPVWANLALTSIDGDPIKPDSLVGKVVLVVNVASRCSYTVQYEGLQALYRQYRDKGLEIVGVPCNQFGNQEPGSSQDIANFCASTYGVTFPLLEKQAVNGPERSPLYATLLANSADSSDISWNFEKFLIGRHGDVIARFPPPVKPGDADLRHALTMALNEDYNAKL